MTNPKTTLNVATNPIGAAALRVVAAVAFSILTAGGTGVAQTTVAEAAATLALVPEASESVREGAILYDHNCSACHGDLGGGLEEARMSFPQGDRTCTRCHRATNPPQMDHFVMSWRNAFDVGVAPSVIGPNALQSFPDGASLFAYLRATMPRPFPGSLDDETYLAITVFLIEANGGSAATVSVPADLEGLTVR